MMTTHEIAKRAAEALLLCTSYSAEIDAAEDLVRKKNADIHTVMTDPTFNPSNNMTGREAISAFVLDEIQSILPTFEVLRIKPEDLGKMGRTKFFPNSKNAKCSFEFTHWERCYYAFNGYAIDGKKYCFTRTEFDSKTFSPYGHSGNIVNGYPEVRTQFTQFVKSANKHLKQFGIKWNP